MSGIKTIQQFYRSQSGVDIFSMWKNRANVGDAIVPSAYVEGYIPYLLEFLSPFINKSSLVSIGSGCGLTESAMIKSNVVDSVISTDIFESACNICRDGGLAAVCCGAENLPFQDSCFSAVFIDGVFGHLFSNNSHIETVSEIKRVTSYGAPTVICDDVCENAETSSNPRVRLTRFSDKYFKCLMTSLGGEVASQTSFYYDKGREGRVRRRIAIVFFN